LRAAYFEARKILKAQDAFCSNFEAGLWDSVADFPENPKWEMLVDVLRGKVKVGSRILSCCTINIAYYQVTSQCQEVVDIDALVRVRTERFDLATS
jgi:hypothetical protein